MITFLPLGGGNEIGANCYYLSIGGAGIILDTGMHPLKSGWDALPDYSLIAERPIDHALISHAHQDHIAALPYLIKRYPYVQTAMTPQTLDLATFALHNAATIMMEQIPPEDTFKVYSHDEIDLLLRIIREYPYDIPFDVSPFSAHGRNTLQATFYDAGHILGSAGILLEAEDTSVFYTGDINMSGQSLEVKASLPRARVETLILECTLGATDSEAIPQWGAEASRFAKEANKIISNGGSVLVPVFAIGKTQEMLTMIWKQMEKGKLVKVPIFTGGMGRRINRVYDRHRYRVPITDADFKLADIPQEKLIRSIPMHRFAKEPCIILASSGMVMPRTFSFRLAEQFLRESKCAIFTVGYMDPQTPGYRLLNAKKGDSIQLTDSSEPVKVACEIEKFRFSAHARREGLLEIVEKLRPANVILTHGDEDSVSWLGARILRDFPNTKVYAAKGGKKLKIGAPSDIPGEG